jgi:hypothetical protein
MREEARRREKKREDERRRDEKRDARRRERTLEGTSQDSAPVTRPKASNKTAAGRPGASEGYHPMRPERRT